MYLFTWREGDDIKKELLHLRRRCAALLWKSYKIWRSLGDKKRPRRPLDKRRFGRGVCRTDCVNWNRCLAAEFVWKKTFISLSYFALLKIFHGKSDIIHYRMCKQKTTCYIKSPCTYILIAPSINSYLFCLLLSVICYLLFLYDGIALILFQVATGIRKIIKSLYLKNDFLLTVST